jgi:hypothetical protein
VLTRRRAKERFGVPDFVGHGYEPSDKPGSTLVTVLSTEYPENCPTNGSRRLPTICIRPGRPNNRVVAPLVLGCRKPVSGRRRGR